LDIFAPIKKYALLTYKTNIEVISNGGEMINRKRRKAKNGKWSRILAIPIFLVLSYGAIRLGVAAGNLAFSMDSKIVRQVDVENFKVTLNSTLPIIDTVYNSGNVDISLSGQIANIISEIFDFDIKTPLTILNAQSSHFYKYYKNEYSSILDRNNSDNTKDKDNKVADNDPDKHGDHSDDGNKVGDSGDNPDGNQKKDDGNGQEGNTGFKEDASSIYFEETDEEKDFSKQNTVSSGKILLQNMSKFKISNEDIEKMLKEPLNIEFDRKGPKILIYHTHTTESYLRSLDQLNKENVASSSRDSKYNMIRVGNELANQLEKKYGIDVIHNGTTHDYPSHSSAYSNSLRTIDKYLKSYPSIKVTLDIHRDAVAKDKPKLRVVTEINGKKTAKIMFVVGTNGTGLDHPNWKENLKLAIKLQENLNSQHPDLTRPIYISNNRYNQHLASGGGLIIEIGADGNTLDEALESVKYLAKAINEVIIGK